MSADRMIPNRDWSRGSSNGALGRVVAQTSPTAAKTNGWVIFVANSRVASRVTGGRATSESPWAWLTATPITNDETIATSDSPLLSSKIWRSAVFIILITPRRHLIRSVGRPTHGSRNVHRIAQPRSGQARYHDARQARSVRSVDLNVLGLLARDSMRDFRELARRGL